METKTSGEKVKEACKYLRALAAKQDGEQVPPQPAWFAQTEAHEKEAEKTKSDIVRAPYVPGPDDMIFEDEI